jgi:hypothetical protein
VSEWALFTQADWGKAERIESNMVNNVRGMEWDRCLLRRSADRWCWRRMRKSMRKHVKKVLEQLPGWGGADTRGSGTVTHGNSARDERICVYDCARICKNQCIVTSVFSVLWRLRAYFEFDDGNENRAYV